MKKEDHILVQRVVDGDVTRKEFDGFQQRLRKEDDLLEAYRSYSLLNHTLCEELEGMPLHRSGAIVTTVNRWAVAGSLAIAAAVALLAAVVWKMPASPAIAETSPSKVEFSEDAIWEIHGQRSLVDGSWSVQDGSELDLSEGRAKITLAAGGLAVIDAPARFRLESAGEVFLQEGRGFFRLEQKDGMLEVETPSLKAVDLGTAFGISASPDRPDELHVFEGRVRLEIDGQKSGADLVAGDGARVDRGSEIARFAVSENEFSEDLGEFKALMSGPLSADDWEVKKGAPEVKYGIMSGSDFEAFRKVPELEKIGAGSVVLATLEVLEPEAGSFHSDNWSGMSFFKDGKEILFFGDSYGDAETWSLDLKQGAPVVLPEVPIKGAQEVTMRYDVRSGQVSLHLGGLPLVAPFCRGWLEPGQVFDEVRLGAAYGASIAVKNAEIRVK